MSRFRKLSQRGTIAFGSVSDDNDLLRWGYVVAGSDDDLSPQVGLADKLFRSCYERESDRTY